MRLLHITVPQDGREQVVAVLEAYDLPYVLTDETSGREVDALVTTPVPDDEVEPVLDELKAAGVSDEHYVVVLDVNTLVNSHMEEPVEPEEDTEDGEPTTRISRDELQSRAEELITSRMTYGTMTAVSAVVATAGVLMDSAAVVVGSMVIAPLIGPSLAASVGTVLDDHTLFRAGVKLQLLGVALAIIAATAFALIVKQMYLVPPDLIITEIGQVRERLAPDFLALAIAFGAGVAGALSLATGVSAALVGVMIAVALIPPAAVIGIGLAWGLPTVVMGAAILLALNLLAINLSALGVLWYIGFRPSSLFETSQARSRLLRQVATLAVAIALISLFLGVVTYGSYQAAGQDDAVAAGIEFVLEDPAYAHLEVTEVTVERNDRPFLAEPERVIITLSRPAGAETPVLADALAASIADRLDRPVEVEVVHVERERAGYEASNGSAGS